MNRLDLLELLKGVQSGSVSLDRALNSLSQRSVAEMGFANLDLARGERQGVSEVVLGEGKTPEQVASIAERLAQEKRNVLVTRSNSAQYEATLEKVPDVQFHATARVLIHQSKEPVIKPGIIGVLCAGSSDIPVGEEAALTLEFLGNQVRRIYDVGVAGLQRILSHLEFLQEARVLVVIAGMEGALPSVVAGLTSRPVIATPTSVGYGASFNGVAALLGMLNSCGSGVTVVNIDNGFGAAFAANQINSLVTELTHEPGKG